MSLKIILNILVAVFTLSAWGAPFPQRLLNGRSDFSSRSLGEACYTLEMGSDLIPCNPAFLAHRQRIRFFFQGAIGEGGVPENEVHDFLSGDNQEALLESLYKSTEPAQMEAQVEVAVRSTHFALSVLPSRLSYYGHTRNQALPVITMHAMQTDSLLFSMGTFVNHEWSLGFNSRLAHRKFAQVDGFVTDLALAENTIEIYTQNALYFEPAAVWTPQHDEGWAPKVTFALTNWAAVDEEYDSLPTDPIFQLGASVSEHEVGQGFHLGANYSFNSPYESVFDPFRVAAGFSARFVDFAISWSQSLWSTGLLLQGDFLRAALSYEEELEESDDHRWIFMLGAQF